MKNKKIIKHFSFEEIVCPLCYNEDYEILCKKSMFDIPINLSICTNCGFVYLNPRWIKENYDYFYQQLYDLYFYREENSIKEIKNYNVILNRINGTVKLSKEDEIDILDIGAGMGNGVITLKKHFFNSNLFAIESSKRGQDNLKKQKINVLSDDVNSNWDADKNRFDLIIMRHVLEHLLYPEGTLKKIHNCLSDDGYLYIGVPNLETANYPLTKSFFRVVHTLYFTKRNLKFLLEKLGFEIIKIIDRDKSNVDEIYVICRKSKKKIILKDKLRSNFNEFNKSQKKILELLKIEKKLKFQVRWGLRNSPVKKVINSNLFKKMGIKRILKKVF